MKDIAIYVEGGGDTVQQKAELRTGLDALLGSQKASARAKRLGWRLAPSGGRQAAFDAFQAALVRADQQTLLVLLVDSESELKGDTQDDVADAKARVAHLTARDRWDLKGVDPCQVHLMVQCMEAWIVSDPDALERYYGKNFHAKKLPARPILEDEPKDELNAKLANATRDTTKGEYTKIKHASKILALIDAGKVAERCPRFKIFTKWLTDIIESA